MSEHISKRQKDGKALASGERVMGEAEMQTAASIMIGVLRSTAAEFSLPPSIMQCFDTLDASSVFERSDGSRAIYIYFNSDLHRNSLYDQVYDGVDNIIALFNNGYEASDYVYGWWDGHRATGDNSYRSGINASDAWVISKKSRAPLGFIQHAVRDFNGNYGFEYNVTAIAMDDYNT